MLKAKNKLQKLSKPIAVVGAGAWGTALALQLARLNGDVRLWGHNPTHMQAMQQTRCNQSYLPDIIFPGTLIAYADLAEALNGVNDILLVVPSHAIVQVLQQLKPFINAQTSLVLATKGLDRSRLLHDVVRDELGDIKLGVLSGPSFAKEVALNLPTAVVLASEDETLCLEWQQAFHGGNFRAYTSTDVTGVEIGGAVKNILAIATGMCDGLQLGANARCALITRGLAEMTRLGLTLGASQETFMGLAGMGDLVLTCTDNQSRNRRFGLALGAGKDLVEAKAGSNVIEGARAAVEIHHLAKQHKLDMPIVEQVYQVLQQQVTPKQAVENLLSRDPKAE
tara:strand:+ start:158482 stop:159495 length:1014 start_codon:yes stop_codon:yes gene_type:complete